MEEKRKNLFTLKNFDIFMIEIKTILNVCPLSSNDSSMLTFAHFLINISLINMFETDFNNIHSIIKLITYQSI